MASAGLVVSAGLFLSAGIVVSAGTWRQPGMTSMRTSVRIIT
jgi:hypothetical protein